MKNISESNHFDQLIYVRLTEACNMKCDHCFIPANPKRMTPKDCEMIPDMVRKITKKGDRVILQWHGGEPTLFGAKRFRAVLEMIKSELNDRTIIHGIQTNLLNFDEEWAVIYKEFFESRIGVSWDYSIRHLRDGSAEFEQTFFAQIQKLREQGIAYDLTITAAAPFCNWVLSNPSAFFTMLEELSPAGVHIEKLTKTGLAKANWSEIGVSNLEYSNLMSLIFAYSRSWMGQNKDWMDGISPLSDIEKDIEMMVAGGELQLRGCTSGACDTKFHTIDANGYKFGCTAINSEVDNAAVVEVVEMISPQDLMKIRSERIMECKDCQFKTICNTGCVASTTVDSSGECNGGFTLRQNMLKLIKN